MMSDIVIGGRLAQKLQEIAAKENRSVEDVIETSVDTTYPAQSSSSEAIKAAIDAFEARAAKTSPLEAFLGMFDDDITDLSSMTKEDIWELYRKEYGGSD